MGKSKANKAAAAEAKPEEAAPAPEPKKEAQPKKAAASPKPSPKKGPAPDPKKSAEPSAKKKGKAAAEAEQRAPEAAVGPKEVQAFFEKCLEMMASSACRDKLKDHSVTRCGIALIDMQKEQWDEIGVSRDAGRAAVDRLGAADKELLELRAKVVSAAKATFMQAIRDRKPKAHTASGDLPRDTLLEFYDVFNLRVDHDDMTARIKEHSTTTGDLAKPVLLELEKEVFDLLGVEAEHGNKQILGAERFKEDMDYLFSMQRWQRKCDQVCLEQLRAVMADGVELKCEEAIKLKLFEIVAHEGLNKLDHEEKQALLTANGKKVQVLRRLPAEARQLHLQKLVDKEKIELIKVELLLVTVQQAQQSQIQMANMARCNGPWKAGVEFKTHELIKTVDKEQAAIAKGSFGRVLEVDRDGDIRAHIPSKDRSMYFISRADFGKLKLVGKNALRRFEGQVTHVQFGRQALPVFITMTSPKDGVWAIVGQSADILVEFIDNGTDHRLIINQEETRLEGNQHPDGHYEGRVIQEGDPNGHFFLREIPYVEPPPPVAAAPKAEAKPVEDKTAEAAEKPAEAKPAEEKPAAAKPAEEKPAEEKPAEEKPAAAGSKKKKGGKK